MNGEGFLQELEKAIDYANSEEYIVRVSSDSGTGNIIAGGGDNKMKVSDVLTISFSKALEYKFIEWCAVQKDDESVLMNEYVEFGDKNSLETTVKLLKVPGNSIVIKPICEKTLSVIDKFPVDSPEGVERDSTIIFTFSSSLSEKNDLSRIKIEVSSSTTEGNKNFSTPIIQDKKLIIMADMENRITVADGTTKVVTVTIPKDFNYVSGSGDLEIGEEIVHKYTINSSTCDKTDISFGTSIEDSGVLKVDGKANSQDSQEYSIGKEIDVTFKPAEGYKFLGWECNDSNAVLLQYPTDEDYDENGFNETSSTAAVKLLVISAQKEVVVTAKVLKIPSKKIRITSNYGKISPNNEQEYKEGDEVQLMFTADSEYQFIRWRVVDINTKKEIENQDFVTFNPADESNTSFIFNKASTEQALLIEPLCLLRPTVMLTLPQSGEKNIVRNRAIRIVFSKKIDENSLKDNIHIWEGFQRVSGDEILYEKNEISNKVTWSLSKSSGTTLYINLKENELFSPSCFVSIEIGKGVQSTDGSSFETDYTMQFQTGNSVDSLDPKITSVTAGFNNSIEGITVYAQDDEKLTGIESKTVTMDAVYKINENAVTGTGNQLNFYIDAADLAGSKTVASDELNESAVTNILYRITRYVTDEKGILTKDDSFNQDGEYNSILYRMKDYSDDSMNVSGSDFKTITGNKISGCIATYNLDELEYGLYRFDISSEDVDGNNGFVEEYWANHLNGYKSFFVVKDTNEVKFENMNWIDFNSKVDSDFIFKCTDDTANVGKILRLKYCKSYFGIEDIVFDVNNGIDLFKCSDFKVRYGTSETYSSDLPEIDCSKSENSITLQQYSRDDDAGYLFIEGLSLGKEHADISIDVTLKDKNKEQESEKINIKAINDQMPPRFYREIDGIKKDEGPLTASYTYVLGNAKEHVWPRPGMPGVVSTEFWDSPDIKNKDGNPVRWFYTNATISSGKYGIALALNFEDERNITWFYKQHSTSLMSDANLANLSISPNDSGLTKGGEITKKNGSITKTFTEGTWSICMKDEIGNCSKAYTFVVIKDHTKPSVTLDNNEDMRHAMTLGNLGSVTVTNNKADYSTTVQRKYRNTNIESENYYDFFNYWEHNYTYMDVNTIFLTGKKSEIQNVTLDISLTGNASGLIYWGDKAQALCKKRYLECKPSRTGSGLSQYCINWAWADWNTSNKDSYIPSYPYSAAEYKTAVVDYQSAPTVQKEYQEHFGDWEDYTPGTDISWKIYHNWGNTNIDYKYLPPLALFLKDACGNLNYIQISNPYAVWANTYNFRWEFVYTSKN